MQCSKKDVILVSKDTSNVSEVTVLSLIIYEIFDIVRTSAPAQGSSS